jgi:galactose mutarotase-like enzyme
MMYVLENDFAMVSISSLGAEVRSFILKENQKEYIWQGNPDVWMGRAPLVFPVVGRLKGDEYTFEGTTYYMEQHGFGSNSEFEVIKQETDCITFSLKYNETTMQMYPFKFELQIHYHLEGTTLTKAHTMENLGTTELYYAIGGHDGYNVCINDGEVFEDYYLDFGKLGVIKPLEVDEKYHILKETYDIPLENGELPLNMLVFKKGALVCHDIPVKSISVRSRKSTNAIHFKFDDFKTLGIWSKYLPKPANYICLEPWSTLPDCAYIGKELTEKVDIRKLLPGVKETLTFSVTIE